MSPALSDVPVRKVQHSTIKRGTLSSILRQAGLTPHEFLSLIK